MKLRTTTTAMTGVLIFLAIVASASAARPQPKPGDKDAADLKALQDERVALLVQVVEILTTHYQGGLTDVHHVLSTERELCDALLDATDDPVKRVALLNKELDRASGFLKITEARQSVGTVTQADVAHARAQCLDIKIKLLRERNRNGSPAPTGAKTAQGGVATSANEEYRLVNASNARDNLESILNVLAKQGWKVRTTALEGRLIILARNLRGDGAVDFHGNGAVDGKASVTIRLGPVSGDSPAATEAPRADVAPPDDSREVLSFPKRLKAMATSTSPFTPSQRVKVLAEFILELPNR